MRRSLNIKYYIFFFFLANICSAQIDTSKYGFTIGASSGLKLMHLYTGSENGFQIVPTVVAGIDASIMLSSTVVEIGFNYQPKLFSDPHDYIDLSYQKETITQHFLNINLFINQKLLQRKKNILSVTGGFIFSANLYCGLDTVLNDGTVRIYKNVSTERVMGFNIYTGLRYSYIIGKKNNFYAEPFFSFRVISEFPWYNYPQGSPGSNSPFAGRIDNYNFGFRVGFQWTITKKTPKYFVQKNKK